MRKGEQRHIRQELQNNSDNNNKNNHINNMKTNQTGRQYNRTETEQQKTTTVPYVFIICVILLPLVEKVRKSNYFIRHVGDTIYISTKNKCCN